jgi:hypothetical protein
MVKELNSLTREDLKSIFSEVFDEKLSELKISLIPSISDEEMEDITEIYGKKPQFDNNFEELSLEL